MMQAVLSNAAHPEYGAVTLPFPIPREDFGHCIELLEALEIGKVSTQDCHVDEINSKWPILGRLEGTNVDLDELDYLAKRLDSFDDGEAAQFQAIYEDEKYHNAVFVGKDEHGVARHAHKRSTHDTGKTFRINVEGSDPRCSFHWTGVSDRLYVFEGPIDLLSYITLHPEDWRKHNYVACCGTSSLPVLWMLKHNPALRDVCLCLDNDKAGHTASLRLAEQIAEQFGIASSRLISENKDWNDDLTELAERDHAVQMVQQIG